MQVLKTQLAAKGKGYSDVVYLDAVENKYVEEVSSCNIFVVKVQFLEFEPSSNIVGRLQSIVSCVCFLQDGAIATPELKGTILPGITRKSIIELARSRGYKVDTVAFFATMAGSERPDKSDHSHSCLHRSRKDLWRWMSFLLLMKCFALARQWWWHQLGPSPTEKRGGVRLLFFFVIRLST